MKKLEIKNQNGRSMIEMLGVLAIIGVLSVGGIAGYSKAMTKYRINKAIEQITLIAGNIRSFFAPQGNYEGLFCACGTASGICTGQAEDDGCPIIKKAKLVPDEMLTVNNSGQITDITNSFGYRIDMETYGSSGFSIEFNMEQSDEVCIELLSKDWSNTGVASVGLGYPTSGENLNKTSVNIDDAVTSCSTAISACKNYGATGCPSLRLYFDK